MHTDTYACRQVCMHVCMHTGIHACQYVCIHAWVRLYRYMCMCVSMCMHAYMCGRMQVFMHASEMMLARFNTVDDDTLIDLNFCQVRHQSFYTLPMIPLTAMSTRTVSQRLQGYFVDTLRHSAARILRRYSAAPARLGIPLGACRWRRWRRCEVAGAIRKKFSRLIPRQRI